MNNSLITLVLLFSALQVGVSGILVYYIINEWTLGYIALNPVLLICIAVIVVIDLIMLYWMMKTVNRVNEA